MSEAKHTPGPWFTHREGFSTVYIEARIGGGLIQEVAACGPTNQGSEQQEANARLIAAAPELLEALRGLDEAYCRAGTHLTREERTEDRKRLIAARAAIAKATGQPHE